MLFGILEKDGIKAVTRQNDKGMLYVITYIDHRTGCVFNGSALGKQYSANGISERCAQDVFLFISKKLRCLKPISVKRQTGLTFCKPVLPVNGNTRSL